MQRIPKIDDISKFLLQEEPLAIHNDPLVSSCSLESDKKPEESEQCKENEQEKGFAAL